MSRHLEAEPEVEDLSVSDITSESFRLTWTAEEDIFDTFVIMIRDTGALTQPQEVVKAGDERSTVISELIEDTEYAIELFGLITGRRSQSISSTETTGTRYSHHTSNGLRLVI